MRKDHYAEPASDNAQPEVHEHGARCSRVLVRAGRTRKPLKSYLNKNLSNYLQDKFEEELKDDIEKEFHGRAAVNATQLRFQSRGAAVTQREDGPAKANRPAMILIREEEPFQRVSGAAGFD